jgi:signal peptidase I
MGVNEETEIAGHGEEGKDRFTEISNTIEWLIIAFILAFIFRAFVMEAFRIPTGSMASTLMGAHFRLCCPRCGYKYARGFVPEEYGLPQDTMPADGSEKLKATKCPNCGYMHPNERAITVENGDRILVLKCIYQFFEPKRWDVVVFKNPLKPEINYIKRLVGKPGETVQIIDGDIYIDGVISRKSAKVQRALWFPVYNNDYQGLAGVDGWQRPWSYAPDSGWRVDDSEPTMFHLDAAAGKAASIAYDTSRGSDFEAEYAYNDASRYGRRPNCSDLKVRYYVEHEGQDGGVGAELSKYGITYRGWVDFKGDMTITRIAAGAEEILAEGRAPAAGRGRPAPLEFANVDHMLTLKFGKGELTHDLGSLPDSAGERKAEIAPSVKIVGAGKLAIRHIAIFRDIYYISGNGVLRATEDEPFELGNGEYFVLGDNSPSSLDGRLWSSEGIGNNGERFRKGVVPKEYMAGKALLVYWPSGYEFPWPKALKALLYEEGETNTGARVAYSLAALKWIPNVGRLRLIYGGSGRDGGGERDCR